jgi:hypothetical protein
MAGAAVPAIIVGCNSGLGICMAGCVIAGVFSGPIYGRGLSFADVSFAGYSLAGLQNGTATTSVQCVKINFGSCSNFAILAGTTLTFIATFTVPYGTRSCFDNFQNNQISDSQKSRSDKNSSKLKILSF